MQALDAEVPSRVHFDCVFRDRSLNLRFSRNGFVIVDFLDDRRIAQLLALWNSEPDPVDLAYTSTAFSPDLAFRKKICAVIERAFEEPARSLLNGYRTCMAGFIRKRPNDASGTVALHQDPAIVDEARFVSINIWCPLIDTDRRNGCLRVVPGSHRINRGPRVNLDIDLPYPTLLNWIDANFVVEVPMKAGQALVYTQALFHGSSPNRSDRERVVAGCMTVPEDSRLMMFTRRADVEPGRLASYEVTDDYYREYRLGDEPDQQFHVGFVDAASEELDAAKLSRLLNNGGEER